MKHLLLSLITLAASAAMAADVAIVDSGTDFDHVKLKGMQWTNPNEIAGNYVDDDGNGKVDDAAGWNFAEGYSKIFFPQHLTSISPKTFRLFEIVAHQQAGTASEEDLAFWQENVLSLPPARKQALLTHLNFYGQYAHGTHVAGIVAALSPKSRLMAARVFPDSPPDAYESKLALASKGSISISPAGVMDFLYGLLAQVQNGMFKEVGDYLGQQKIAVANYSLGVPLSMIAKQALALRGNSNPTEQELSEETTRAFKQFEPLGKQWMAASPGTLFVVAAGNDGQDNDRLPTFPASVRMPNSITVAATHDFNSLAKFSNTGKLSVDVAAPGVAIMSTVPALDHARMLPMSGTSMAAPYVTGLAAGIKDLNPALSAEQVRAILMGTVDLKPWLAEKVISGGVVNRARAYAAAERSRTTTVDAAIAEARATIADQPATAPIFKPAKRTLPELEAFANKMLF